MSQEIEKAECQLGYTREQLKRIFGDRLPDFNSWMIGQTGALCNGARYNYETKKEEPSGCGPHGYVVYSWDVERYLQGRPVID